jgi:dihydrofolate reductase
MGRITAFTHVSLDGFFAGPRGEIDWFKTIKKDAEYDKYTHGQARSGSALVFGRTTYDMMKSYWPTPDAIKTDPEMAKVVNESAKIVFSRSLKTVGEEPNWKNVRVYPTIDKQEVRQLGKVSDITILGSGSIVQQFANLDLIDEYRLIVMPIILGTGKPLLRDVKQTQLKVLEARAFGNGIVALRYAIAA